jgi:two-component system chemotaxis response regulator CheY
MTIRVLVVDDAPYVLNALKDILQAYKYEVYEAHNGEEGLEKYKEVKPDVVLMDILMPIMDGVSATKKIMEFDPQAKIIVITAVGKRELDKDCLAAGAKGFVVKPFKIKDLLKAIKTLEPV